MKEFKIFISSRCNDVIEFLDGEKLTFSQLRFYIKEKFESESFLNNKPFEVLINEHMTLDGSDNAYDACFDLIDDADLVFVLYNGEAGWVLEKEGEIGICHAESDYTYSRYPKKTLCIPLLPDKSVFKVQPSYKLRSDVKKAGRLNSKFKTHWTTLKHINPHLKNGISKDEFLKKIKDFLMRHASSKIQERIVISNDVLNVSGIMGESLIWKKLPYRTRIDRLTNLLENSEVIKSEFKGTELRFGAIPDAMSVAEARENVGRVFLRDAEEIVGSKNKSGILHIIAVYKSATERQLRTLIGHPDVTLVQDSFGWYVYDMDSHVQMVFLTDCENENTANTRIQQFFTWTKSSRENKEIEKRAKARFKILSAINEAKELVK